MLPEPQVNWGDSGCWRPGPFTQDTTLRTLGMLLGAWPVSPAWPGRAAHAHLSPEGTSATTERGHQPQGLEGNRHGRCMRWTTDLSASRCGSQGTCCTLWSYSNSLRPREAHGPPSPSALSILPVRSSNGQLNMHNRGSLNSDRSLRRAQINSTRFCTMKVHKDENTKNRVLEKKGF